jgi:hypothetical protein
MITFNVFVKDQNTGSPIAGARVTALTKNQIIDPPVRLTSGDGGCNLYFQGPEFTPDIQVSLNVDAAGYTPWCTEDHPVQLGRQNVDYEVRLVPFV